MIPQRRLIPLFAAGLLAVGLAMGWVTWQALELERRERHARADSQQQENIRLALWRMDSMLTAILARESARPYFEFQPFYSNQRAYTAMFEPVQPGEVLVPSPLLNGGDELIRLYFQLAPDGQLTSPQNPTGNMRDLAESARYVAPDLIIQAEDRLNRLGSLGVARHVNQTADARPGFRARAQAARAAPNTIAGTPIARGPAVTGLPEQSPQPDAQTDPALPTTDEWRDQSTPTPASAPGRQPAPGSQSAAPPTQVAQTFEEYAARQRQVELSNQPQRKLAPKQMVRIPAAPGASGRTSPLDRPAGEPDQALASELSGRGGAPDHERRAADDARYKAPIEAPPTPAASSADLAANKETRADKNPLVAELKKALDDTKSGQKDLADQGAASEPAAKLAEKPLDKDKADNSKTQKDKAENTGAFDRLESAKRSADAESIAPKLKTADDLAATVLAPSPSLESPAGDQTLMNFGVAPAPSPPAPLTIDLEQGPFHALWLQPGAANTAPELLLIRRVLVQNQELHQGLWIDWPALRTRLLGTTSDLLPQARLEPLSSATSPSGPAEVGRLLATIPARLVPGPSPSIADPTWTPRRATLLASWIAVLGAGAIVILVLRASMALSERRGRFVSAVTHELRTPLTTFCLYSQMLADGMVSDEAARRDYLATLKSESRRLARVVEDVLDYARLARPKPRRPVLPVAAPDLIAQCLPELQRRAERANLTLIQELALPDDRATTADPRTVERILLNLVDNACKYANGPDRRLHLRAHLADTTLHIQVADHGPGVPATDSARLFEPFERGQSSEHQSEPGLGLGLSISRGLARELGGDLRLISLPGFSAVFELTLPTVLLAKT